MIAKISCLYDSYVQSATSTVGVIRIMCWCMGNEYGKFVSGVHVAIQDGACYICILAEPKWCLALRSSVIIVFVGESRSAPSSEESRILIGIL